MKNKFFGLQRFLISEHHCIYIENRLCIVQFFIRKHVSLLDNNTVKCRIHRGEILLTCCLLTSYISFPNITKLQRCWHWRWPIRSCKVCKDLIMSTKLMQVSYHSGFGLENLQVDFTTSHKKWEMEI